jgi:AraC family transcriptional regulator, regulatory protein of adaptative response / methylated-DNA-[protein]-cysteine methyltransferase
MTDYERIETAIVFLQQNFQRQPALEEVAAQVHLSPFHFQKMFTAWAGVSPKKFVQFLSIEYAKQLLQQQHSLSTVSFETGLSGTGRLHDMFISIEGMTPGDFKAGGAALQINYSFGETPFGHILIASTTRGICHLNFIAEEKTALEILQAAFPQAALQQNTDLLQQQAFRIFSDDWSDLQKIKLHLKATPFQLKVWQSLLQIPFGQAATYANLAAGIQSPKAARAVGTAIGQNPVAYLIPCHRVIRATGVTGEYHWGSGRKLAILGWEAARVSGRE